MLVSFHPQVPADVNLRLAARIFDSPRHVDLLRQATGVVLPQSCRAEHYWRCRSHCPRLFPNYDWRYGFEGKCGNGRLFDHFGVSKPEGRCFQNVAQLRALLRTEALERLLPAWPLVVKPDRGGSGYLVRLVREREELEEVLEHLRALERKGEYGFVVQQHYETGRRDLRVVVLGDRFYPYWRCQDRPEEFRTNLGRGGRISKEGWPEQQRRGVEVVANLCRHTGLNLAAFDLIFPVDREMVAPLFLEINFFFGRRGVGGSDCFWELLRQAVKRWRAGLARSGGPLAPGPSNPERGGRP